MFTVDYWQRVVAAYTQAYTCHLRSKPNYVQWSLLQGKCARQDCRLRNLIVQKFEAAYICPFRNTFSSINDLTCNLADSVQMLKT